MIWFIFQNSVLTSGLVKSIYIVQLIPILVWKMVQLKILSLLLCYYWFVKIYHTFLNLLLILWNFQDTFSPFQSPKKFFFLFTFKSCNWTVHFHFYCCWSTKKKKNLVFEFFLKINDDPSNKDFVKRLMRIHSYKKYYLSYSFFKPSYWVLIMMYRYM